MSESIDLTPEKIKELQRITLSEIISKVGPEIGDEYAESIRIHGRREIEYEDKNFNLKNSLEHAQGIFIEVAGPTTEGYLLADFDKLNKHVYVSNIESPGLPIFNEDGIIGYIGRVDFAADSTKLPIADKKVGALFGSCLLRDSIPGTLQEADRVLSENGLLILQSTFEETRQLALDKFDLKLAITTTLPHPGDFNPEDFISHEYIFMRKKN